MFRKHGRCHVQHIWKPFLCKAELVCPQSCFLLNRLHARCPSFLQLASPPLMNAGPSHGPEERGAANPWTEAQKEMPGPAVAGGDRPAGGDPPSPAWWEQQTRVRQPLCSVSFLPKVLPGSNLSGESECIRVCSAVRSKNSFGRKPRNVSGNVKPRQVYGRCEAGLAKWKGKEADQAQKGQELRGQWGPGSRGYTSFPHVVFLWVASSCCSKLKICSV